MPLLKDLNCSIELSDNQEPLQELGTVYGDAFVETFIPVPKKQQKFTIHLSSRNFIAPGIAMFVFIDGIYQCNRNRQDMKLRRPPDRRSLVDFKVRQKEERQKDGSMIAREWTFEKLDHASADGASESCSPHILENIGCIEVVVLRCAGTRDAKAAANMNMDGAADCPDYRFGRDSRAQTIAYDDRDPFISVAQAPVRSETPYRSPYAETVRSHEHFPKGQSRYSEPVSPRTRPHRSIPAPGFQYGSGPLPPSARAASYHQVMGEAMPDNALRVDQGVDPTTLEKIVAGAVKRGVEESRKGYKHDGRSQADTRAREDALENASQIPGAWPTSPRHISKHTSHRSARFERRDRNHAIDGYDSTLERLSKATRRESGRSRVHTRIAWDEEPGWDKQSKADGWGSANEREQAWNTDETSDGWEEARRRSRSKSRTVRDRSRSRRRSPATDRISARRSTAHSRSRTAQSGSRSYWKDEAISSSEDNDDWTSVELPSDSSTSVEHSDFTLKPSHSRSQAHSTRSKPARRKSRHKRSDNYDERRLSQLFEKPQWRPDSEYGAPPPSVLVTNGPTMMSVPMSHYPEEGRSRKASVFTQSARSIVAPPPTWGCASEKMRKGSLATTFLPPAPFSTVGGDHGESWQSSGSSSWGVTGKKSSKGGSAKKASLKDDSWGEDKEGDKRKSTWGDVDKSAIDWDGDGVGGWGGSSEVKEKTDDWNAADGGWCSFDDAKPTTSSAWDMPDKNDTWNQTKTADAAMGEWNTAKNGGAWGKNDAFHTEQDDPVAFQNEDPWGVTQSTDPKPTTNEGGLTPEPSNIWATAASAATTNLRIAQPTTPASNRHTATIPSKHRVFPPPPPSTTLHLTLSSNAPAPAPAHSIPSVPPEPLHAIPPTTTQEKGVEHQVLAGRGTAYGHAVSRPRYVDSFEAPYAVFRFKYRGVEALRGMFGGMGLTGKWVCDQSNEQVGIKR